MSFLKFTSVIRVFCGYTFYPPWICIPIVGKNSFELFELSVIRTLGYSKWVSVPLGSITLIFSSFFEYLVSPVKWKNSFWKINCRNFFLWTINGGTSIRETRVTAMYLFFNKKYAQNLEEKLRKLRLSLIRNFRYLSK